MPTQTTATGDFAMVAVARSQDSSSDKFCDGFYEQKRRETRYADNKRAGGGVVDY